MCSQPGQVLRLQIQGLQGSQILSAKVGELVQELIQRLALALPSLCEAVKGIEWARFTLFEDDPRTRHPVGAFTDNKMTDDVERAPAVGAACAGPFVGKDPSIGHSP